MNREYTLNKNKNEIIELAKANPNFTVEDPKGVIENIRLVSGHNDDNSLGFIVITGPEKKDIYFEFNFNDTRISYDNHRFNKFELSGKSYFRPGYYTEALTNHEFYRQLSRFKSFLFKF